MTIATIRSLRVLELIATVILGSLPIRVEPSRGVPGHNIPPILTVLYYITSAIDTRSLDPIRK